MALWWEVPLFGGLPSKALNPIWRDGLEILCDRSSLLPIVRVRLLPARDETRVGKQKD
jgi:hypothetical protein